MMTKNRIRIGIKKNITMELNKSTYLESEHVLGLVNYICGLETGKNQLGHNYDVSYPAWKADLKARNCLPNLTLNSLTEAFNNYFWLSSSNENFNRDEGDDNRKDVRDFDGNNALLTEHSMALQNGLDHINADATATFLQCIKILDWGGTYKGSIKWIVERYEQGTLIKDISSARNILDGDVWSVNNAFMQGSIRMDSGLTKIFALSSENSIIYDDRVGAAMGLLTRKYLQQHDPKLQNVPLDLEFMVGRSKNRNPSEGSIKFTPHGQTSSKLHARSNLLTNWIVGAIVQKLGGQWNRRKVEAALFIVGYRV
jgi:hypothetical protein